MSASTHAPTLPPPRARPTRSDAAPARRYELDWLRTAAVFGLIPFHTAVIFTTGSFDYVKNAQTSAAVDVLTSFISIWGIPLLFLVAGGASRFALATRSTGQYLNERVTRLLVPFTFGMLLIVPLQVYIGRLSSPTPPNFVTFYGDFLLSLVGIFPGHLLPGPEWIGHLWFIPPLMLFSALALPFAHLLRTGRGARAVDWLAGSVRGYATLALFGAPLAMVQFFALESSRLFPTAPSLFIVNAIGVVAFLLFFLYGYLLYLDERFIASIRRDAGKALLLGSAVWLAMTFAIPGWQALNAAPPLAHVTLALLRGYSAWWWVMGALGMAIRYLHFTTPTVEYLTRAAYPVYIIHMPILSLIAFWVVRLDMNLWLKFALIVIASLVVSLAFYDLLIRRVGVLRLLFGLRAKKPRTEKPHARRPGATTSHSGGSSHSAPSPHTRAADDNRARWKKAWALPPC